MNAVLLTDEELSTLKLPTDRPSPRIVLGLAGGIVQGFSANGLDIEVVVLDYDDDDTTVSQSDGGATEASIYEPHGRYEPAWVNSDIVLEGEET